MRAKRTSIAKISTPRLFGAVPRERLFARLDANQGRPLIWVEGPPGAGKTTLVATYLDTRRTPTLWYQVDAGDADPANLFNYFSLALTTYCAKDVPSLPTLVAEHLTDVSGFGRMFFRELFSLLPAGAVLVLDNYQEVAAEAVLHDVVQTAVGEVPPGSSIICISRLDTPASFAPLVANGRLSSLRWDALQLTLDETRAIAAGREIREDWLVQALHKQSEGWAAGITLMLERLGSADAVKKELPSGARESVFDYFAGLIFESAPDSVQRTLMSVAFLPNISVSMAVALSGNEAAGTVLEDLYRRHLFTDRRHGTVQVYQFHALFRDFLQSRVKATVDESELRRRMSLTADVLEHNGDVEAAVEIRIDAQQWHAAARSILDKAGEMLSCGRRHTIEHWILSLPPSVFEADPWLSYWLGMARAQTSSNRGAEVLREALARFRAADDVLGQILSLTALLNSAFAGYVAVEAMHDWLDELLLVMKEPHSFSSSDVELRVWGVLCTTLFWVRPWHPWTTRAAGCVEALLPQATDRHVVLAAASSAMATAALSGDFARGDRIASATAHLLEGPATSPVDSAWWCVWAGYLRFLEARYEEALAYMGRSCSLADANGMRETFTTSIYHRYMVEFRVSGWTVANATLEEMKRLPLPTYPVGEAMFHVYRARRAQFLGQREDAADLAELTHVAIMKSGSSYQEMLFGLVNAELLLDAGRIEPARTLIARSRTIVEGCTIIDCFLGNQLICESLLALVEGKRQHAVDLLENALCVSKEKTRRYFLRYLEVCMQRMFAVALEEGVEVEFVQQLIRMFRLKPPADAPELWPRPVRIRTFGRFEVRIKDEPLEFARKVPKKTLALLKALISHGAEEVPEQWLCDSLWGDEEADAARQVLGVTVLRLRKLLGNDEAVGQQGGKVWLDRQLCWVDSWCFEKSLRGARDPTGMRKALEVYAGAFLAEDDSESWSVATRERLRGKFIHALAAHGRTLEAEGRLEEAIDLYQRGMDADVIVEEFHRGLMRCYRRAGRFTEAVSAYRRLRQTLSVVLGVTPIGETEILYRAILGECASDSSSSHAVPVESMVAGERRTAAGE